MLSPIAVTSTIVKSKDEAYGYDTDEELPASMVRAHSSVGDNDDSVIVKVKEEAYEYDTDNEHLASTVHKKSSTGDDGDTSKDDEDGNTAEKATTHDNHASTESEDNRRWKKRRVVMGTSPSANEESSAATMDKSTKQKDISRQLIARDIGYLGSTLVESGNWDLKRSSFTSNDKLPLDHVHFDEETRRYQVNAGSTITEDDVILQAMVVFSLYRMERGWGKGRSNQALSIWSGPPATDVEDAFPLENLWRGEIQRIIAEKKLGKTTLGHNDNFDNFHHFYGLSKGRRARRSTSYIGQVHVFGEQAAIQFALYLHRQVSSDYALLASFVIHHGLDGDDDTMFEVAICLLHSARKETRCFPKAALRVLKDVV